MRDLNVRCEPASVRCAPGDDGRWLASRALRYKGASPVRQARLRRASPAAVAGRCGRRVRPVRATQAHVERTPDRPGDSEPRRADVSPPIRARTASRRRSLGRPQLRSGNDSGARHACRRARLDRTNGRHRCGALRTRPRVACLGTIRWQLTARPPARLRRRHRSRFALHAMWIGVVRAAAAEWCVPHSRGCVCRASGQRRASASPGVTSSAGGIVRSPASASARFRASRQAPASASA